jgi:hypothetical protein
MDSTYNETFAGRFAEELSELADGSISLFVILPIFRAMVVSDRRAGELARFEAMVGEHLAHLDGILGDVLVRRDRSDGSLTRVLFNALGRLRALPSSTARDGEIVTVVEQAQLFLMGSCSFSLQLARDAELLHAAHVLQDAQARLGSLALQQVAQPPVVSVPLRAAQYTLTESAA